MVKKIYDKINSPVGFVASLLTIILSLSSNNVYIKAGMAIFAFIYLSFVILYIIRTIFNTSKAREEFELDYINRNTKLADAMHNYYHNLRDYTSSVYATQQLTIHDIKETCKNICGYIAEIYNSLFKGYLDDFTISVCIKLIKPESMFDENYMDWEMETIARNPATVQQRLKKDFELVKISDNSDFQIIISEKYKDDLFSFADMRKIEKDFLETYKTEYKNSRGKDFINFYRSTIVVPIKIDGAHISKELISHTNKREKKNIILGFLCIDSMKVFESSYEKALFSLGVNYAKSIGDSLYLFFEKVLISHLKNDKLVNK